jgi:L-asparaginase
VQATPAPGAPPGGPQRSAFIAGEDLTPVKARILLMLALTRTQEAGEIQRMFMEY